MGARHLWLNKTNPFTWNEEGCCGCPHFPSLKRMCARRRLRPPLSDISQVLFLGIGKLERGVVIECDVCETYIGGGGVRVSFDIP